MDREIKFRGRTAKGDWVTGFVFYGVLGTFIIPEDCGIPNASMNQDCVEVIPETVGQFTGLLDKDRKEIFENDIVQYDSLDGRAVAQIVHKTADDESVWISGFVFKFLHLEEIDEGGDLEIIGNIHENPELLK